jgi:phosphatidylinositol glycan class A protein
VDTSEFRPGPPRAPPPPGSPVTIVALSRLVYRKGADILALVIPEICQRHPHVSFLIGQPQPARWHAPAPPSACRLLGPCGVLR